MFCASLTLASALLVGAPFEDTQKRFTVDLPRGWKFAPQPGEIDGATFQREVDTERVTFSIRIFEVGDKTTLPAFVKGVTGGITREPGYEQLAEEHVRLAGLSALRRRYTRPAAGDKGVTIMVEDHYAAHAGKGYIVHQEARADTFAKYEPDFKHLQESLAFQGVNPAAPHPHPPKLVGKWLMENTTDTVFHLKADGTFELAGAVGVWRVRGSLMLTRSLGAQSEAFTWTLEGDTLTVESDALGGAIRYTKVSDSYVPLEAPPEPGAPEPGTGEAEPPAPSGTGMAPGAGAGSPTN